MVSTRLLKNLNYLIIDYSKLHAIMIKSMIYWYHQIYEKKDVKIKFVWMPWIYIVSFGCLKHSPIPPFSLGSHLSPSQHE